MYKWKQHHRNLGLLLATTVAFSGSLLFLSVPQVRAQAILQREANLRPAQGEHTFSGTEGQAVVITVASEAFDPTVTLLDPSGTEIGFNDDYGNSLNSTIVVTLPTDGVYKVLARSYSGQESGSYTVSIRTASPYEQAYARGVALLQSGEYAAAIDAYNAAIRIDPNQPNAYQDLASALYGQAQVLQPNERAAIARNYERAIELYEQAGDTDTAQMLRDQLMYLQPETQPQPEPRPMMP
jgi:tetratricopeptide (TPR) repeat protein